MTFIIKRAVFPLILLATVIFAHDLKPTPKPTSKATSKPTTKPISKPTTKPTSKPTIGPTKVPTKTPTKAPTKTPIKAPTNNPSLPTTKPPTFKPTNRPTFKKVEININKTQGKGKGSPTRPTRPAYYRPTPGKGGKGNTSIRDGVFTGLHTNRKRSWE
uniref:Uncharacterized protein n=1 Tax=Proboscia inermis TaxID=420281 RepID=A0A7S0C4K1_9STRA|mmetsp:Transcript_26116/g.26520  ORF Transcript_26116/g.26520 Transcript_26116/m.26520 type:complete len:159 (+) Transcript_26116:80-556(+)